MQSVAYIPNCLHFSEEATVYAQLKLKTHKLQCICNI